ncbi:phosphate:sodium symporter [Winogradskyella sp. PC-19]|uniref:inorganic phosphate transporter n=1 Tax=unclassified Winogradskyella TaxID=2615021 RepID=UPI000B3CD3EF|nr:MULTISPECIES: inorganic phosphate transporter [unclassified Winogradskyella]ARV09925.1 phosphate:sodium symporter [Winogradskyella sp. PC-19]RZN75347.1 MAG: inorganic phosphate transporter [Winogradskyella sp.]
MDNLYIYMLAALAFLAIADLVVGVSNDAVNFLNSAIGSKAVSFKTIMIVASIGVAVGAMTSSGMMEVARKGIFNPGEFMFDEIMIIFMAVMITDILLLDFFNTLGLPTSTTVSIVFELLGASVAVALIKIYSSDSGQTITDLTNYINNSKAIEIILGILLSVVVAFTIGALVQYVSRILLSFKFEEKPIFYSAIFSGVAVTSIMYFIIVKGLKNATFMPPSVKEFLNTNPVGFVIISFLVFTILSYLAVKLFNAKIYAIIIVVGTFALAVAFAGNDLVNFIGVPIAAYNSYEVWSISGVNPSDLAMVSLSEPVQTQPYLLLIAGLIMVLTLWFSSKAKAVVKTSVDLARQDEGKERFKPNFLSRNIVRLTIGLSNSVNSLLPASYRQWTDKQFIKPVAKVSPQEAPAFDLVRAAVNLMVASVLISIATGMKLPLSTTYVTFMVTMGTSLADRAWGSESAVYRVAGVLNVIGGWFFTAFSAFVAASIMAVILYYGKGYALTALIVLAVVLLTKNYISHRKNNKVQKEEDQLQKSESSSTQGVIHESAATIGKVVKRGNKIYTSAINGLATQNLAVLKKNKKQIQKLSDEIDELRDNIFYFIKNLEEPSLSASAFYINILGYLQDITQSLEYISKVSHKHINNNHKKLKFSQIKELKDLDEQLEQLFIATESAFESRSFAEIGAILNNKASMFNLVKDKIQKQVERTRNEESSPKNTTLYFGLLLETKDLLTGIMNLLEEYFNSHDSSVEPATIPPSEA